MVLTLLVEALALAGKIEVALATLDDALAQTASSGVRGWDAEIHRLRGELAGRLPHPDLAKAEDSFRTALAIAREQGTRGYELRAATSLARPSTAGSPKALTPKTSRRRRHCSTRSLDLAHRSLRASRGTPRG